MQQNLQVYNTIKREKEVFKPLYADFVGMYVCGPTLYDYVHLGNCRTFTSFDIIYRYLLHLGYKVRYVRNITDVGHLVNDAEDGEDKIGKRAKLECLEPMEIVQKYANDFREVMKKLNNLSPSIEPTATGHIVEQIKMTQDLLNKGLAYESKGSVYFDIAQYNHKHNNNYGVLSGRIIEELNAGSRQLEGQEEKRNPEDFALWKQANPEHLMRWQSPWGEGFPGWHLECSVMSQKYLGTTFDIHGGGMDLKFPHHECEIAQSVACCEKEPVKYWLHTNMLTINGQKMSKSANNGILPNELFIGNHALLEQGYSPMVFRTALLQTHYRSTMDISNEVLKASEKVYKKLMNGLRLAKKSVYRESEASNERFSLELKQNIAAAYAGMNDDFNTAITLAQVLNLLKKIHQIYNKQVENVFKEDFDLLMKTYLSFVEDIFGLRDDSSENLEQVMNMVLSLYKEAKEAKNYNQVDFLRTQCKGLGVSIKDTKNGVDWTYEE